MCTYSSRALRQSMRHSKIARLPFSCSLDHLQSQALSTNRRLVRVVAPFCFMPSLELHKRECPCGSERLAPCSVLPP